MLLHSFVNFSFIHRMMKGTLFPMFLPSLLPVMALLMKTWLSVSARKCKFLRQDASMASKLQLR